jgi:DNA-binding PadR family transcriptional regulator
VRYYAARAAQQFAEATKALEELRAAGDRGATGRELFGDRFPKGWSWRNKLLRRLEEQGLVTVTLSPDISAFGKAAKIYAATPALEQVILANEVGTLLWPASAGAPEIFLPPDPPGEDGAPLERDEPIGDEESALEALVKMTAAILENVAYIREKQDALARELEAIRKAWE